MLGRRDKLAQALRRPPIWRAGVTLIALSAVVVRLVIVARSHGGADLFNWTYFSRLPLHGINPFAAPPGVLPAKDGNNPPVQVALYSGLLAIHDSPSTLRVLFALSDGVLLLLVGLCFPRSLRWRAAFLLFYAFNPFVLVAWTGFAEDKTLLFLGVTLLLLALERGRDGPAWVVLSALTVFKFIGTYAAPSLALHSWRKHRRPRALLPVALFVLAFLLSNLPWFPHSLDAFSRRAARLSINPPIHSSPTILLARIGVYAPIEAKLLTVAALAAALALYAGRRIDIREAVVASVFAGYVFLPDEAFNRILFITLPFLLLLDLSLVSWILVWIVTCFQALAGDIITRGVPHALSSLGGPLHTLFGREGSVLNTLWMNLLTVIVLTLYVIARRAGQAPLGGRLE